MNLRDVTFQGQDAALTLELADVIGKRPLEEWVLLLEPVDCCVTPVLTAEEAARHPLFNPQAYLVPDDNADEDDSVMS